MGRAHVVADLAEADLLDGLYVAHVGYGDRSGTISDEERKAFATVRRVLSRECDARGI